MDRLHLERAGASTTETAEELGRRAEAHQIEHARMEPPHGHGGGRDNRRRNRTPYPRARLRAGFRWQALYARGFLRARLGLAIGSLRVNARGGKASGCGV